MRAAVLSLLLCLVACSRGEAADDATRLLRDAQAAMAAAVNAVLATHALPSPPIGGASPAQGFASREINSRIVSPRPTAAVENASGLAALYISTNSRSRKHAELQAGGRANLAFYDSFGIGCVAPSA